ncbi:MAG: RDD family protein [Nocardioides sp.]
MSETPPPPPPPPPPPSGSFGGPPSPPSGHPQPGSLLDRFLARLIDGIGFGIAFAILSAIFAGIFYTGFSNTRAEVFFVNLFVQVISVALYLGYYAYFESTKGATFGKQLMKLKVVGPDQHSNPTMTQALLRSSFQALGLIGIIPFLGFLGPLASLAAVIFIAVTISNDTVNRQGWHDHFAGGTRVLKIG